MADRHGFSVRGFFSGNEGGKISEIRIEMVREAKV